MKQGHTTHGMSSGERGSWLLVTLLCLFFGYRLGAQSTSGELAELKRLHENTESKLLTSLPEQVTSLDAEHKISTYAHDELTSPHAQETLAQECLNTLSMTARDQLCPPCDCPCAVAKPKPAPTRKKRLPPPKMNPLERSKLLAWVKRHSDRLKRCRDAGQPIYRLHTTLKLKLDVSGVSEVQLKGDKVPASAISCIRQDMLKWPPPPDLTPSKHPLLMFTLQLD